MKVEYSPLANGDLGEIWEWNAKRDGREHADRYVAFLKAETEKLCWEYDPGQPVPGSNRLRLTLLRRRQSGYGHLVVFVVVDDEILRVYFHTSQDWQNEIERLRPD